MTSHLCISVTFLDPLFHGKCDGDEPEWPPSPMRLFQALLGGSRTGCHSRGWLNGKAEAFCWLERQKPPVIVAPTERLVPACTLFVPNNDGDKTFERQERLTGKVAQPHRLCNGDTLHYLWAIEEGGDSSARSHAELLCREARRLLALGWGIDQVVGNGRILTDVEAAALPGHRWRARDVHHPGQPPLRVPKRGSLRDLEGVHQSFVGRVKGRQYLPPLKLSRFDTVAYLSATALPPRPYAAFELPEGIAFRQVDVAVLAAMLRSLACRDEHRSDFRDQFKEDPEVYLAGHVNGNQRTPPRFSYLPLPTIGHEHADGMIRRLLIAEPVGGDGSRADWAQNRLRNASLIDKDGNQRGLLLDLWRHNSRPMVRRYVGEARTWTTVTPVILPGFDDGKHAKAEALFVTALRQADFPVENVAEFALRKAPFWPGSFHPRDYRRPDYLRNRPAWHVRLTFRKSVAGPLALGAGRHCGLGLFAVGEAG